jgi:hypothetical protein
LPVVLIDDMRKIFNHAPEIAFMTHNYPMKNFGLISILFLFVACDPYGFGFKKNPAYVLDEAFKAVTNQDVESFLEVTSKEALCIYGTTRGIDYLKEAAGLSAENITLKPTVLQTTYYQSPMYVDYWSYYNERYQVDVLDKTNSEVLLKAIVDCDYGVEGEKDSKYINLKPKKYRIKECRLIKIIPQKFAAREMPDRCKKLNFL